jgi:hypothetical protein
MESYFQETRKLGEGEAHKGDGNFTADSKAMVRSHLQQVNGELVPDETKNIIGKGLIVHQRR